MTPRLLDSAKTLSQLAADNTAGLGSLAEAVSCIVTEERNGAYILTMRLPITAAHYKDITVGGIIKAKANDNQPEQLFRIQKISRPIGGIVTISANHISYDLGKTSVAPCEAVGAAATMTTLKANMTGGAAFSLATDIPNSTSTYANAVPQSLRACLGGQQGSVLDVFGGEYEWNNLAVTLHAARGRNRGVVLRYGKNITDLKQEETIENMYTAVMPFAQDSGGTAIIGTLQTIIPTAEPKILNLDLSDRFNGTGTEPTPALVNAAAQRYIEANNLTSPKVSLTVSFVALWQTEEYKTIAPLERVQLCDTVTVYFEKLGINATAKVIKTVYNTLTERYDEIELGDAKSTLARTINGITDQIDAVANQKTAFMDSTIASFSNLIANGMGLFMTGEEIGGATKWYLHNKPTRVDSQYQWTVNASGFAVSNDYGATWSAGFDADGNAVFNSLAANIVKAMRMEAGTLTFGEDTTTTLSDNATDTGALFAGNGTMEFKTNGQFYAQNIRANNRTANSLLLTYDSNYNTLEVENRNTTAAALANKLQMQVNPAAVGALGASTALTLRNNRIDYPDYEANGLSMYAWSDQTVMRMENYKYESGYGSIANDLKLEATSTKAETVLTNYKVGTGATVKEANHLALTDDGSDQFIELSNYGQYGDGTWGPINSVRLNVGNVGNYLALTNITADQQYSTIQLLQTGDILIEANRYLALTIGSNATRRLQWYTTGGRNYLVGVDI